MYMSTFYFDKRMYVRVSRSVCQMAPHSGQVIIVMEIYSA